MGVLKAFQEENIPIDIIGVTSMGAIVGGVYARELDTQVAKNIKRSILDKMRYTSFLTDLTFPFVALTTGATLNSHLQKEFRDVDIEDLPVDFYAGVTNFSTRG